MVWCKISETHQIDFLQDSNSFYHTLIAHVDNEVVFEEDEREMSNKKYVGRVGQNAFKFTLKKKNTPNYHSATVKGQRADSSGNDKIDMQISGIDEKFVSSFLLMYLAFCIMVRWPDFKIGDILFLIVGFGFFSSLLIYLGRDYIKYIKTQMEQDFKIRF